MIGEWAGVALAVVLFGACLVAAVVDEVLARIQFKRRTRR